MEKRIYVTKISGTNDYVRGRISGIGYCICDGSIERSIAMSCVVNIDENGKHIPCSYFYKVYTTENKYKKFKEMVERFYPNVCEFDV